MPIHDGAIIRNISIHSHQKLAEQPRIIAIPTREKAYRITNKADSDFFLKVRIVHLICDTTTGPLFENFVQKSEKIVDEYTRKINFTLKNGDCAITAKFRPPKNLTVFTERFVFAWFSEVCCRKTKGTHSPSSIFETLNSLLTRAPHPCMVQLDSHEISLRSFLAARLFGNYVAKLRIK